MKRYRFNRIGRTICLLALFSGVVLGATGCTSGYHGPGVEIVYWTGWSGHELKAIRKLVDEFNRTHPDIHVRMVSQFTSGSQYEKVRIAFAGGTTPDVMSTVWAEDLASYAMRGVLTPLDPYLKQAGRNVNTEYTPGVARMLQVNGHVYALAMTTNTDFIAYNKDIFKQAGINDPPRTILQLDEDAAKCTLRDANGNFIRLGFHPAGLEMWAYVFDGRWYDPKTGKVTANDPHNVAALRWLVSFAKKYGIRKIEAFETTFGNTATVNGPFFVGKIAMWSTGEWAEKFIRRYAPHLNWGWFPLPSPPGGRPDTTVSGGSVFVIPAACKHKQQAWTFLNWMTSPHAVGQFCHAIGNVPPLRSVGKLPMFQDDPLFRFAIHLANGRNSFGPPPIPIWTEYSQDIQRVEDEAVHSNQSPQKLLDRLQARMQSELNRTLKELKDQ